MGKRFRISRRAILRGMGSVGLGLPALEIMSSSSGSRSTASAQSGAPKRFLLSYAGLSTGADTRDADLVTPDAPGAGYALTEATQGIADFGVHSDVSMVTGLWVPHKVGDEIPPGGRDLETIHVGKTIPQTLSGTQGTSPRGPTAVEIAADAIAGDRPHRVLHYLVQQESTVGGVEGAINFENDGRRRVAAIQDPRLAYESLFTGFTPPSGGPAPDPMVDEQAVRELRSRRSVLDLVSSSTERLLPRLGTADRQRLELHFDQVRDLETRLDGLNTNPRPNGAGCSALEIGSGLDQRGVADAFARLIVTSWACDLSNVTALSMTERKCWMPMSAISSLPSDAHESTHSAGREVEQLNVALNWLIGQFAHITQLARETPDADGSSLLDNAAMGLFFEGGFGLDPSTGQERRAHSTENMVIFVAGRAGGLRGGEHILGDRRHPARVMTTLLNAVGVETDRLGEISGTIPELVG